MPSVCQLREGLLAQQLHCIERKQPSAAALTQDACHQLAQRHAGAHGNLHKCRHERALVRAEEVADQAEHLSRRADCELTSVTAGPEPG